MARRVLVRRLGWGLVLAGLLIGAVRLLAIQGWLAPVRIVSGSMAEHWLGEHFFIRCEDCNYSFAYGAETPPLLNDAVCPNCGFARNAVAQAVARRGDRVLIDRAAYWFSAPARYDVVTFPYPGQAGRYAVKRIMGLPGERLAIRDGEVYANGQIVRKSLAQFQQSAVVVHDNDYQPQRTAGLPARWRAAAASSWQSQGTSFSWRPRDIPPGVARPSQSAPNGVDWLVYHHWRCYASSQPRTDEVPVADNCGYNQGESRELRPITDLVLACRVASHGTGHILARIHDGRQWIQLQLDPEKRAATILQGDVVLTSLAIPSRYDAHNLRVDFGVLDGQFVAALDGHELASAAYTPSTQALRPIPQPVAIGSDGLTATVDKLVLYRDVYYLDAARAGATWESPPPSPTPAYIVLGDNPYLSEDSRLWAEGRLARPAIRGRVLPIPW
jgi:signal peptidase I